MKRSLVQSLMYDYCLDRLSLRDCSIKNSYDSHLGRGILGFAKANWDNSGRLTGGLEIAVKRSRSLESVLFVIAHELTHIQQYVSGTAYYKGENRMYAGAPDHYQYSKRAVEREANKNAAILAENFINKHWDDFSFMVKFNVIWFRILEGRLLG